MNKCNHPHAVIFGALFSLCALLFVSCNNIFSKPHSTGIVTFAIDKGTIQTIARDAAGNDGTDETGIETVQILVEVELTGDWTDSKSVQIEQTYSYDDASGQESTAQSEPILISFEAVPVGKTVTAKVQYSRIFNEGDETYKKLLKSGKSEAVTIHDGENPITVTIYDIWKEFPVTITITGEGTAPSDPLGFNSIQVYAIKRDSQALIDIFTLFAGDDAQAAKDALSQLYDSDGYAGENYWSPYTADWGNDASYDEDTGVLTLTGTMSLLRDEPEVFVGLANYPGGTASGIDYVIHVAVDAEGEDAITKVKEHAVTPSTDGTSVELVASRLETDYTPYALYKTVYVESDIDHYDFVLADSATTDITGIEDDTASFYTTSSSLLSYCFDNEGYIYAICGEGSDYIKIWSNNPKISGERKFYGDLGGKIAVDTKTGHLYVFDYSNSCLYRLDNDDGSFTYNSSYQAYTNSQDYNIYPRMDACTYRTPFTVYNNIAYFAETVQSTDPNTNIRPTVQLAMVDLTQETAEFEPVTKELDVSSSEFCFDAYVSDIICEDGSLYMLVRDSSFSNPPDTTIHSRGAIISYSIKKGEFSSTITGLAPAEEITSFSGAWETSNDGLLYKDAYHQEYFTYTYSGDFSYTIKAPYNNNESSYFAGPEKFIARKPKKLVISDTGYLFYTDSDILYKKKVNRVVEIDLEKLSMEKATKESVKHEFNGEYPYTTNLGDIQLTITTDMGAHVYSGGLATGTADPVIPTAED